MNYPCLTPGRRFDCSSPRRSPFGSFGCHHICFSHTICLASAGSRAGFVQMFGHSSRCVKLALHAIVPAVPDLVIGGINHGDNSSVNVHYSGTMGVVIEGCLKGIPSIGFSCATTVPMLIFLLHCPTYAVSWKKPGKRTARGDMPEREFPRHLRFRRSTDMPADTRCMDERVCKSRPSEGRKLFLVNRRIQEPGA